MLHLWREISLSVFLRNLAGSFARKNRWRSHTILALQFEFAVIFVCVKVSFVLGQFLWIQVSWNHLFFQILTLFVCGHQVMAAVAMQIERDVNKNVF